jgi:hypothetical protein
MKRKSISHQSNNFRRRAAHKNFVGNIRLIARDELLSRKLCLIKLDFLKITFAAQSRHARRGWAFVISFTRSFS